MNSNQIINSFLARTVDRLTSARRAILTMLTTILLTMTAQTAWAEPTVSFPTSSGGSGTSTNPYKISSKEDLKKLANDVNSGTDYYGVCFIVTQDIDMSTENDFKPIGDGLSHAFMGTFDGHGNIIKGLNFNLSTTDYVGLFGNASAATIKNLMLANSTISGKQNVGGIVGLGSTSTTVENCVVTNTVSVTGQQDVGGIVGMYATIRGCVSAANVSGSQFVGGIIGNGNLSTVERCLYIYRYVTASSYKGAITGYKGNGSLAANYYIEDLDCKGVDSSDEDGARKALTVTFPTNGIPSGTATVYNVSGITCYTGMSGDKYSTTNNYIILYNGTYYSGAGETVTFLYNYDGYQVSVTDADQVKVDFTKDIIQTSATDIYHNHTFTMPAKAVTITATDVWGVAGGKDGSTADNAYTITSTAGLDLLAQNVNAGSKYYGKYFKLGADITYTHTTDWDDATSTENNFTPIGSEYPIFFGGHFDGKNHTISGIRIYSNDGYQGLFGNGSVPPPITEIKNIKLANARIKGKSNVGGIVGQNENYTITNCHIASDVAIIATNDKCGGIAGYDGGTNSSIIGCTSAATVSGNNYVGGIAGEIIGSITDCFVTGATVSGTAYVGAIAGYKNDTGTLKNNYYYNSTVTIGGTAATDAGCNGADVAGARKAYTVTLGTNANGFVLMDGTCTAHGSTPNAGDISIKSFADNSGILYTINGTGSTTYAGATETIKLKYTGTPAEEGSVVGYSVNGGEATAGNTITMPAADATITEVDVKVWGDGDGTSEETAYVITTTEGLDLLAQKVNAGSDYSGKYFKLDADITYDKTVENNFTPIGDNSHWFRGTFDGNGKTISGININNSTASYQGIFGFVYGTVKNLVVSNSSIVGYQDIGAIAGYLLKAPFGTIENCSVGSDVTLSGNSYIGGIAGASYEGTIKGCTCAATITGTKYSGAKAEYLGGIVGATLTSTDPSVLTDNLFTGTISDNLDDYIGAIVGKNENGTLTNNVHTSTVLGGIGAASSTTGADVDGARKAAVISAATGVTIAPTGEPTPPYNVSGITSYADNTILGCDGKLYLDAATETVKLNISYTAPDGYAITGYTDGNGTALTANADGTYTLTMTDAAPTITATTADVWGVAAGADGKSEATAYTITTTAGLDLLAQRMNPDNKYKDTYFKLGKNITYTHLAEGADGALTENNFTTIGGNGYPFKGHFDGKGYTISGIRIYTTKSNQGLFGLIWSSAEVKNVTLADTRITAAYNVGGIAGFCAGGKIADCHVTNTVEIQGIGENNYVYGGIVGCNSKDDTDEIYGIVSGCISEATLTDVSGFNYGGIAGVNNGTLENNFVIGATIPAAENNSHGAIVGQNNNGTLTNNYYTACTLAGTANATNVGVGMGVGIDSNLQPVGDVANSNGALSVHQITLAEGVTGVTIDTGVKVYSYDSKDYYAQGNYVKIIYTGTPATGYQFGSFNVGEGVTGTLNGNSYTMMMPARDVTVSVSSKKLLTNTDITVGTIADQTCTGSELKPAVTVNDGTTDITGQCDITYTDNTAVGTATVTITAKATSNAYAGETTMTFTILRGMSGLFADGNQWTGYVAQEDLTLPDGLTAYTVTALGDKTATATAIGYLPKDEPVLLCRSNKTVNNYVAGPYEGTEAAPTGNLLRAATASSQPTAYRDYLLYQDGFVLVSGGTLATGQVYLSVPQASQSRTATRSIIIDGDGTTAISTTDRTALTDEGSGAWFDMQGRRYDSKPTRKGLYVRNGKKVVIK